MVDDTPTNDKKFGWFVVAIFVGLVALTSQCSGSNVPKLDNGSSLASDTYVNSVTAAAPAPIVALDKSGVLRGGAQFRLVNASGVSGGAKIFSENCYDALSKSFDSHQLDRCGGFDQVAVKAVEDGAEIDADYFQSEAAAGRYLSAATGAGLNPSEADLRLATLAQMASKVRGVRPKPPSSDIETVQPAVADDGIGSNNSTDELAPSG